MIRGKVFLIVFLIDIFCDKKMFFVNIFVRDFRVFFVFFLCFMVLNINLFFYEKVLICEWISLILQLIYQYYKIGCDYVFYFCKIGFFIQGYVFDDSGEEFYCEYIDVYKGGGGSYFVDYCQSDGQWF